MIIWKYQVEEASDQAIQDSLNVWLEGNSITDISESVVNRIVENNALWIFHNIYNPTPEKGEMMSWSINDLGQGAELARQRLTTLLSAH